LLVQFIIEYGATDGPTGMATDSRMQGLRSNLRVSQFTDGVKGQGDILLGGLVAGGEHTEDVGQGTYLGWLVVESRGLDPGVLAVVFKAGVIGVSGFVIGMLGPITLIPGVLDRLLDAFPEVVVVIGSDRFEALEVGVGDVAAGEAENGALGVHWHVGYRQVIGDAGAILGPVGVS